MVRGRPNRSEFVYSEAINVALPPAQLSETNESPDESPAGRDAGGGHIPRSHVIAHRAADINPTITPPNWCPALCSIYWSFAEEYSLITGRPAEGDMPAAHGRPWQT